MRSAARLFGCLLFVVVLLGPSMVSASEHVSTTAQRSANEYADSQISAVGAFACDTTPDPTCAAATRLIFGTPGVKMVLWVPTTQVYYRHYLITDSAGTVVYYDMFSGSLTGLNYATLWIDVSLPAGDYTFTGVVAGDYSGIMVTDQVRFSVR